MTMIFIAAASVSSKASSVAVISRVSSCFDGARIVFGSAATRAARLASSSSFHNSSRTTTPPQQPTPLGSDTLMTPFVVGHYPPVFIAVVMQRHQQKKQRPSESVGIKETVDQMLDGIFQRHLPLPHKLAAAIGPPPPSDLTLLDTMSLSITLDLPGLSYPHTMKIWDDKKDSGLGSDEATTIQVMNRNARRPKKANHGARPCSRSSRRKKKNAIGKRRRG